VPPIIALESNERFAKPATGGVYPEKDMHRLDHIVVPSSGLIACEQQMMRVDEFLELFLIPWFVGICHKALECGARLSIWFSRLGS